MGTLRKHARTRYSGRHRRQPRRYRTAGAASCAAASAVILYAGTAQAQALPSPRPPETTAVVSARLPATWVTVRPGDSLSSIAGRLYGNPAAWTVLYQANRDKIRDPDVIGAGLVLKVPPLPAVIPAPPATVRTAAARSSTGGYQESSFEKCVIARESGGNAQVMNSSGHYGLYQFSKPTWVAYGGTDASFGRASAAEQHQVFANAMARGGQSNWSPYDGC